VGLVLDSDRLVCAGTAERLSREVETVERVLEIGPYEDLVEVHLLEDEVTLVERCGHANGCYRGFPRDRAVFERRDEVGSGPSYWIPFDRIDVEWFGDVPEMLRHGIAASVADLGCTRPSEELEELLARTSADGLTQDEGRVVGQLVRALLRDHPAERLVDWLAVLDHASAPDYIRATFAEVYGVPLEQEWDAATTGPLLPPPQGWCVAPELPPVSLAPGRWELDETMECANPWVEDIGITDRYALQFSIYLPEAAPLSVEGEVPAGTSIEYRTCGCGRSWLPLPPAGLGGTPPGWLEFRVTTGAIDGSRVRLNLSNMESAP
jgi:hypothetical protein